MLVIAFADLRWGGRIMAAGFLIGAVIRIVARPARKAGGLNVRSRSLDVTILVALGVGAAHRLGDRQSHRIAGQPRRAQRPVSA